MPFYASCERKGLGIAWLDNSILLQPLNGVNRSRLAHEAAKAVLGIPQGQDAVSSTTRKSTAWGGKQDTAFVTQQSDAVVVLQPFEEKAYKDFLKNRGTRTHAASIKPV